MDSRSKNGKRNIVAGGLNRILQLMLPFATRTALIYTLGSEFLGLSSLFTSILMVLNLSELGVGSALVFSMYKPVAEDDKVKLRALLAIYKKVFLYIGLAILVLGLIACPFLRSIIKGEVPKDINIYLLFLIYLGNTVISYCFFAHKKALLQAYQRQDILSNINSVLSIGINVFQIAFLLLTHNYYLYVFVYPVFTIIENAWAGYVAQKHYPDLYCEGTLPQEDKNTIKQHVKGIALQKLCSTSRNSLDSIVISMFIGLTTIAMYSNYFYIMTAVHSILYLVPNAIRPTVGNSVASESVEKNYSDFSCMYFIYIWITGVFTTCLMCLYQPFMELWMGTELMFPLSTVALFGIYFALLCFSDIIALYKDAAGLWWYGRYRVVLEAVANLILNFLLGYLWGINGILLATIITIALIGHGYGSWIVFHYYFKGKNYWHFVLLQLMYLTVICVICALSLGVCSLIPSNNLMVNIVIRLVVCAIISNLALWTILGRQQIYKQSLRFFGSVIKCN